MNGDIFCNKCGAPNAAAAQFCGRCGSALVPAAVPAQAGVHYGGFWIRVVAAIIDGILVRLVVHPFAAMFGIAGLTASGLGFGFGHGLMALPLMIVGTGMLAVLTAGAAWLYEALMLSSSYQATLGKMIFGMKVTDLHGNRLSFAHATGRHFAKWISSLTLCIGYIMVGFTERKQGLHDMIAGTLVPRR